MFTLTERNAILTNRAGISQKTVRARFERAYLAASPEQIEQGRAWYAIAGEIARDIATAHNTTPEHAAAVLAQLSPRTRWSKNVAGAWSLFEIGHAPGHIGANVDRARQAMHALAPLATVRGPKTSAFARNIVGDYQAVTVDVWALRTALGNSPDHDKIIGRVGVYQAISECVALVAAKHGETPAALQAIAWIVERGDHA